MTTNNPNPQPQYAPPAPEQKRNWFARHKILTVILAIVVLGGLGSQIGVVISAVVMIGGIEMLRNLGFLSNIFGPGFDPTQYRMLIFGLAMVLIMVWKPRGLVSTREPTAVLREKKRIGADMVAQGEGH